MTLREAISTVESHEFAARVGVASDWATLIAAIESERAVCDICGDPSNARRVAERVLDITRVQVDPRYEHPLDMALAAYLIVLEKLDRDLAQLVAASMLRIPQLWWGSKLARRILLDARASDTADRHVHAGDLPDQEPIWVNDSEEVVVIVPPLTGEAQILRGRIAAESSSSEQIVRRDSLGHGLSTRNLAAA